MTSPVDTSVKYFTSAMAGAPSVSGTAGTLISALDACLVTGFGTKAVDSATVTNGVCRLNFASGVSAAREEAVILVSGATPAGLNGEQKVTAAATAWVEFKTDLPDGAVSGSVTFKMAPLGWEKVFSKTNVAVYRPSDPSSSRRYFRFDDTNVSHARLQMYESMTDVDTGFGVSPSFAGGYYWRRHSAASANPAYWSLIGDALGFYFMNTTSSSASGESQNKANALSHHVGDINAYRSGDAWASLVTGSTSTSSTAITGCVFSSASTGFALARESTGLGTTVDSSRLVFGSATATSGSDNSGGSFPSRSDNGLRISPILIADGSAANGPRGELAGAYHNFQNGTAALLGGDMMLLRGIKDFAGKTLAMVTVGAQHSTNGGVGFFDVTGPWRKA